MKKILTYLGFIGVAVIGTYLAFRGEDTGKIWQQIKEANKIYVVFAMILGYLAIVSRGARWLILLEPLGHKPKLWNSIHAVALAYLANVFVPRSGEIARCGALNQTDKIPMDQLIGTVISERVVDFVMLFIFLAVAILTNTDAFSNMYHNWTDTPSGEPSNVPYIILSVFLVGLFFLIIFWKKIRETKIFIQVVDFLKGVGKGLRSVMKMEKKWAFIAHTVFIWLMYFLMAYVVFYSMENTKDISIHQALFVMVAGGFGMVFPAPGGTGSYQYAVKLAFIALGMSSIDGLAYGNLEWFAQTFMMVVSGGIGFFMIGRAKLNKSKS